LRGAIRFIGMATLRAFTACVPRVNSSLDYPRKSSLVLDKVSELSERPRMQNCSLLSPNRDPVSDTAQLLQRDPSPSVFSVDNDLLGYDMIHIGRKATLTTGQLPELTTAPTSPLSLKFGAKTPVPVANSFYGITGVGSSIRIRCDIGNPKVDAKPFVYFPKGRLFHVAGDSEIPFPAMIDQVGFALTLLELFDLTRSGRIWNCLSPAHGPDVDVRFLTEAQYSVIVGNGPSLPKYPLSLFVYLVGIGDFGKYTNRELRCEFVQPSGGMIKRLLEGEVLEDLDFPSLSAKPVRALVAPMKSTEQ